MKKEKEKVEYIQCFVAMPKENMNIEIEIQYLKLGWTIITVKDLHTRECKTINVADTIEIFDTYDDILSLIRWIYDGDENIYGIYSVEIQSNKDYKMLFHDHSKKSYISLDNGKTRYTSEYLEDIEEEIAKNRKSIYEAIRKEDADTASEINYECTPCSEIEYLRAYMTARPARIVIG